MFVVGFLNGTTSGCQKGKEKVLKNESGANSVETINYFKVSTQHIC